MSYLPAAGEDTSGHSLRRRASHCGMLLPVAKSHQPRLRMKWMGSNISPFRRTTRCSLLHCVEIRPYRGDSSGMREERVDIRSTGGDAGLKMAPMMRLIGLAMFLCMGTLALAQTATFKTRLSPVAMDASMLATVAGEGSTSAQLTGTR